MKKIFVTLISAVLFFVPNLYAQIEDMPFFDSKGAVRIQTTELDAMADTIAVINHRADDIVWSRTVYRIVDMREKQNYQLYFPVRPSGEYRSLFRVMVDAIVDGVDVYRKNPRELKPYFDEVLEGEDLSKVFAVTDEENLILVNGVTNQRTVQEDRYVNYARNQIKFITQELYFFNKHTSRMYRKVIAIAPLYALHPDNMEARESMRYLMNSILCWFSFDELRPHLAKQFVLPKGNDTERLTYDDYFTQKLYSSYLLGDSNMYNRTLLEYESSFDENGEVNKEKYSAFIRKEQKRIETELLNFEMDLWTY